MRGPGIQQRAIHREMLVRGEFQQLGFFDHGVQELASETMLQEAFAVLAEGGMVEGGVGDVQVEKPLEQEVVLEAFTELPVTPDREQGDQESGFE